jgi:phage terminase small subunit
MMKNFPEHLSDESKVIWRKISHLYDITDDWRPLLQTALEARDRMTAARLRIDEEGMTIEDRFGETKSHPLLPTEEKARLAFLKAWRAMRLDIEPPEPSRKA